MMLFIEPGLTEPQRLVVNSSDGQLKISLVRPLPSVKSRTVLMEPSSVVPSVWMREEQLTLDTGLPVVAIALLSRSRQG